MRLPAFKAWRHGLKVRFTTKRVATQRVLADGPFAQMPHRLVDSGAPVWDTDFAESVDASIRFNFHDETLAPLITNAKSLEGSYFHA